VPSTKPVATAAARGAKALRSVASIHWRARGRFLCCHPCRRDRPLWVNWSQKALTQSVAGSLSYPRYLLYAPIFHAYSQHPCRAVIGCLPPRAGSAALAAACDPARCSRALMRPGHGSWEAVNYLSFAANVRSIRSILRTSARSSTAPERLLLLNIPLV